MTDLASQATRAALAGDWQKAAELNSAIISDDSNDIEALNRLAHAFCSLGKTKEAKKTYQHVLSQDPYNHIARKNLEKLNSISENELPRAYAHGIPAKAGASSLSSAPSPGDHRGYSRSENNLPASCNSTPCLFLEEPGKTKVTNIVNPAPQKFLSCLSPGSHLELVVKKHSIVVCNQGEYIGALPDDLSHRLINLAKLGNKYQAYVKAVEKNNLLIFLQEVKRSKRVGNQPSFPPGKSNGFYPFIYSKDALNIDKEPPDRLLDDEEPEDETRANEEEL